MKTKSALIKVHFSRVMIGLIVLLLINLMV